jgi:FAD dependent oxidoreductase
MWAWDEVDSAPEFPATPWALDLSMDDFPYPRDHHGQWFWESGFDKDAIQDAEGIRDWNLRAVFGAFNAMKNGDGAEEHKKAILTWVAFVGGPRESRRLLGDVILNQEDIVAKREFLDGCVPSTWSIDLHYPKQEYADKFPDNPFISIAVHDRRVDRMYGYPVPYRCFYSRNIDNLFMAGRCISVTHEALGTVRVMKTCGMMGEVVGKAASICVAENCSPRDVYEDHLDDLLELLKLPGVARRSTPTAPIVIPDNVQPIASSTGPPIGIDPSKVDGIVVDDSVAKLEGEWTEGTGLKPFMNQGYRYAPANSKASCRFTTKVDKTGRYTVELYTGAHENRATNAPVIVDTGVLRTEYRINQRDTAESTIKLGTVDLVEGQEISVLVSTEDAGGIVHVDALKLTPVK